MGMDMMNNNNQMNTQMMNQMQMMMQMMNYNNIGNMNQQANNMMMNFNNNNNNNNQNQENNNDGNGISVIFRVSGNNGQASAPLMIQCQPHEKVRELIQRYRTKSGDEDPTKKFIFNAKNLSEELTVSEAGIANNANIFVVATKGIKGAN